MIFAAQVGRAIEPAIEPLGFDWKIGIALIASLAAREVVVSTLAQIYAVGDADDFTGLRTALRTPDPVTGAPAYTFATALSKLATSARASCVRPSADSAIPRA